LHDAAERVAEVIVAESRPRCEGRETARLAASFGITTRLVTDAAAAGALATADVLLFGADAVRSDGSVVNKTGTLALCLAARYFGCRALCAATPAKVLPEGAAPGLECMEPAELGDPVEGVEVRNPYFELIPAELIGPVVLGTEATGGEQLAERARRLAALQLALDGREGDVSQ
jgi:translation initiation factor 2B subunit (eIF-2B alpha/beta/delta family)